MRLAIFLIGAYLLGSVSFGILIAAAHGIDLRKVGSGNIGATNLSRALGRRWAYVCFILDLAKGLLPTLAAGVWLGENGTTMALIAQLAVGCAAIIGHVFPVYLGFKGGKGVATSFGVALGLWPYYTICAAITLFVWITFVLNLAICVTCLACRGVCFSCCSNRSHSNSSRLALCGIMAFADSRDDYPCYGFYPAQG